MADCTRAVGSGAVMHKCRLPLDHAGPCMAIENNPSVIARRKWEVTQQAPIATPQATAIVEATAVVDDADDERGPVIGALKLGAFSDFEVAARTIMAREELTPALYNWLTGTASQIALNDLWRKASEAFDAGCDSIQFTRAELERFIPERLRPT